MSGSIDAPTTDLFLLHADLENVRNIFSCLGECACLAIEDRVNDTTFTAGLNDLFAYGLSRMDAVSADLLKRASVDPSPAPMPTPAPSPATIRDRFIMESHQRGHTPAEISQALGVRQDAVLKIIGRLSGSAPGRQAKAG